MIMESFSSFSKIGGCTINQTGQTYRYQYWKRCLDCFPDKTTGACLSCIAVCHIGHNIDNELHIGNFYCDCGAKGKPTCKFS
jgi:Putative zinc finger in N-recognin (UBR box)